MAASAGSPRPCRGSETSAGRVPSRVAKSEGIHVTRPARIVTSFRVDRDLWQAAQAKADARGEYLSEVIRAALVRYVRSKK